MTDLNKYIGIPFKAHGREIETGVDCFGLCRVILKNEFGRDLPEWIPDGDDTLSLVKKYEEQCSRLTRINEPVAGCVGLFMYCGHPVHMALYIGEGKVIHLSRNFDSVIERIDSRNLKDKLEGWYDLK